MCGIAGSINYELDFQKLTTSLRHRGPDYQGEYRHKNLYLFHSRLSIVDLSTEANQPFHICQNYTIVFNGEIYNHKELRSEFLADLEFKTDSDTETLLYMYARYGEGMLKYLDGMFAFAIINKDENTLFLARDRSGKKPLYYFKHRDIFIFASELNTIKTLIPLEINTNNISNYLKFGFFYSKQTPYNDTFEVLAGSYMKVNLNTIHIHKHIWWNIEDYYHRNSTLNYNETKEHIRFLLHQAVKRRIDSSDLEVGTFLSGGIDSGIITAISSQYKEHIKTFTVSFDGEYNEAPLAKLVSQRYNTSHREININFDNLQNDIIGILKNYGEPFADSSAIPS
jgi:asparagine synthase (glutamine-hydrolysing)